MSEPFYAHPTCLHSHPPHGPPDPYPAAEDPYYESYDQPTPKRTPRSYTLSSSDTPSASSLSTSSDTSVPASAGSSAAAQNTHDGQVGKSGAEPSTSSEAPPRNSPSGGTGAKNNKAGSEGGDGSGRPRTLFQGTQFRRYLRQWLSWQAWKVLLEAVAELTAGEAGGSRSSVFKISDWTSNNYKYTSRFWPHMLGKSTALFLSCFWFLKVILNDMPLCLGHVNGLSFQKSCRQCWVSFSGSIKERSSGTFLRQHPKQWTLTKSKQTKSQNCTCHKQTDSVLGAAPDHKQTGVVSGAAPDPKQTDSVLGAALHHKSTGYVSGAAVLHPLLHPYHW
eukprot:1157903-Pelagomonas_calceolata.AAC.5